MTFNWNDDKNQLLKRTRSISFEEIVIAIEEGCVVDIVKHQNSERYPHQRIYLIDYRDYIWAVPHVIGQENDEIFLKTIYPSRKLTKRFRRDRED